MRILILGGSGIIGSKIHKRLKKDYFTTSTYRKGKKFDKFYKKLNLNKVDEVKMFFRDNDYFDVIIFLVGLAHKKGKGKDIDDFRRTNVNTAKILLKILKNEDKIPSKFIYFSTISVYGERCSIEEYNENTELIPLSPYAVTKLECENYLIKMLDNKNLWILRPAPVYSEQYFKNIDRRTKIKNIYYKVGDGNYHLSLCNLNNIVDLIIRIINNKIPYDTYNISDEKHYTYNELLKFKKASRSLKIPVFVIKIFYFIGKATKNVFLIENSIKLTSNNFFPSKKIQKFAKLKYILAK